MHLLAHLTLASLPGPGLRHCLPKVLTRSGSRLTRQDPQGASSQHQGGRGEGVTGLGLGTTGGGEGEGVTVGGLGEGLVGGLGDGEGVMDGLGDGVDVPVQAPNAVWQPVPQCADEMPQ
jgi:hypothetical protein